MTLLHRANLSRRARVLLAGFALSIAAALVAAGCGGGVPADAVATVNGNVISKATFNHWYVSAALQQAQQTGASAASIAAPDPPSFTKCAATKAKAPTPRGVPKPSAADLKAECKQEFQTLSQETMGFLISAQWLIDVTKQRHLTVSDAEVRKSFLQQKQSAFQKESDYQNFLKSTGQTEADLLYRVKLSLLTNKLQQQIVSSAKPVTNQDIVNYYNQNKQRFAQPETRDLLVVLNPDKSKADAAAAALRSGQSWASVAKKYSTDDASKANGGKLPGVTHGQQEKSFDAAIFSASKGAIQGPVKTQFGYYVFRVTNITAAKQQSLAQATDTIRNLLKSQRQQTALNNFVKTFQSKYRGETQCASAYMAPQQCGNAPKQKSGSTTGTAPGGQGQAPPGGQGQTPPGGQGQAPPGGQGQTPPGGQGQAPPGGQGQPTPTPPTP